MKDCYKKGFTLIELLIVIFIIAILTAVIFVVLNPLARFRDSRDVARWQDVSAIGDAIKLYQVDHNGQYITAIEDMTEDDWYMIVIGAMDQGCNANNDNCDMVVSGDTYCVNLKDLVDAGYLGDYPSSPTGEVNWDYGVNDGDQGTGYVLQKASTSVITVTACEPENAPYISISK